MSEKSEKTSAAEQQARDAHAAWAAFERIASNHGPGDTEAEVKVREYLMRAARVGCYRDAPQQAAPKAAPGVPIEIERAIRAVGLTLVKTTNGYSLLKLGKVEAQVEQPSCLQVKHDEWDSLPLGAQRLLIAATKTAPQQEAQEPSHRETVDVVGVRSNGEHVNLEKIAMPPRMKAREIAIEQFGRFKDDDGSDAEMCFGALEYFLEWLIQQGWSKAPQPAPAPLIARSLAEWHEDDGYVAWWAWNGREWAGEPAWIGTPNCEDWPGYHTHWTPHPDQPVFSALAAQGGK